MSEIINFPVGDKQMAFSAGNPPTEIFRVSPNGFTYKGELIEDAGKAYEVFMEWMKQATLSSPKTQGEK